jgi:hypothetical protein
MKKYPLARHLSSPLVKGFPSAKNARLASFFKSDAYYLLRLTMRGNCTSKCANFFKNGIYTEGSLTRVYEMPNIKKIESMVINYNHFHKIKTSKR